METWTLAEQVSREYVQLYHHKPWVFRAPGRINLIGEHTDYNEGYVLPASIDKAAYLAIGPSHDLICRVTSLDFHETAEFNPEQLNKRESSSWVNYILGVLDQFLRDGLTIGPFNAVLAADVPIGGGLSSSAALEAVVAFAINDMNQYRYERYELAKLTQRAENEFIGVRCGIMDMFTSLHGHASHAICLDCRDLTYRTVPLDLGAYQLVLFDTGVKHALANTAFNTRRAECEQGVTLIQNLYPAIHSLRDVTQDMLTESREKLHPLVYQRCEYVVSENERVLLACDHLERGELAAFGRLMYASHAGLQHDYDVSCAELDFLVDQCRKYPEVLGARMMGGGFGGNTLNLIHRQAVDSIYHTLAPAYAAKFGRTLKMMPVNVAEGAACLSI